MEIEYTCKECGKPVMASSSLKMWGREVIHFECHKYPPQTNEDPETITPLIETVYDHGRVYTIDHKTREQSWEWSK